jgi:hypothetical protein
MNGWQIRRQKYIKQLASRLSEIFSKLEVNIL